MVLESAVPNDNVIPLLRPELMIKMGKKEEAVLRLEEIVNGMPENYFAWEKLLLAYFELKDFERLTIKGNECATKFNTSFFAKLLYATGATETGKYDIALNELKKAEILAGQDSELLLQVYTIKADVYYKNKEYSKAFETYEDAMKINSDDMTLLNNYAYYLAEQNLNLKEAEMLAKKVIETEKDNTTFLDTYGWVLYKRGKYSEAAKVFESIINSNEEPDAEWYEHYGYILQRQKKCSKAVELWENALKIDPSKMHLKKEIESCTR
ncbi:MAG TPA: tetratricopeptide repeat protein [Bacteroidales bacterium]|nr:tetratricopeptide repeat protein [Bacteroidales bacterium]